MDQMLQEKISQRNDIIDKLKAVLVDNLNIPFTADEIHPDTPLFGTGLGLDSIDALEIVVMVENEFGCAIADSDMAAVRTINFLTNHIIDNHA